MGTDVIFAPTPNFNGAASFDYTLSDGTATDTGSVSFAITAVNDGPTAADATVSLAENSPNGTVVATVVASDVDADSLSFSINSGNAGEAFAISSTGVITVANSAALNFEVTPNFTLLVRVSDGNGGNVIATITINLTDVVGDSLLLDLSATATANTVNVRVISGMLHAQNGAGVDLVTPLLVAGVRDIAIFGGSAVDTVTFEASLNGAFTGTINVFGNAGNDVINASALTIGVALQGNAGDDVITGGLGNDTLQGGAGRDIMIGGAGHDLVRGQGGSDKLLDGGEGNDTIDGGAGNDSITGGAGNDIVLGGADHDIVSGNAGIDTVIGGLGNDTVHGGADNDIVIGGLGIDSVDGEAGDDTVLGGNGAAPRAGGTGAADVGDTVISPNFGADLVDELFATLFDDEV